MKLKKSLKITLAVIAAVIVLIIVLAALVISKPQSFPYTVEQAEADSLLASEIVDMISDAVVDEDGNIPEIAVVTIPAENVNALLHVAAYRLNRELKDDGIACAIDWENSAIRAAASITSKPMPMASSSSIASLPLP